MPPPFPYSTRTPVCTLTLFTLSPTRPSLLAALPSPRRRRRAPIASPPPPPPHRGAPLHLPLAGRGSHKPNFFFLQVGEESLDPMLVRPDLLAANPVAARRQRADEGRRKGRRVEEAGHKIVHGAQWRRRAVLLPRLQPRRYSILLLWRSQVQICHLHGDESTHQ